MLTITTMSFNALNCDICEHIIKEFNQEWEKKKKKNPLPNPFLGKNDELRNRLDNCNSYAKWIKLLIDFYEYFEKDIEIAINYLIDSYETPMLYIHAKNFFSLIAIANIILPDLYQYHFHKELYESNGTSILALGNLHETTDHEKKLKEYYHE